MKRFKQSTGEVFNLQIEQQGQEPALLLIGHGYSGRGPGLNNPAMDMVEKVGPLPAGRYRMESCSLDGPYEDKGPWVIVLVPLPDAAGSLAWLHGRGGFLVHGDNKAGDFTASEGCVVAALEVRKKVWEDLDKVLEVVP